MGATIGFRRVARVDPATDAFENLVSPRVRGNPRAIEAARQLSWMIFSGELPGGTRLRHVQVAAMLGMSATPVREAFLSLASDGLVTLEHHRGVTVNQITRRQIEEFCDLYEMLLDYTIRRAAERYTPEKATALLALGDEIRDLRGHLPGIVANNRIFHALAEIGETPRTSTLSRTNMRLIPPRVLSELPGLDDAAWAAALATIDAFAAGDLDEAMRVQRPLIRNFREFVTKWLEARGVIPPD
jgi:DNA-binding GntR family transcriptional regulator